MPLFRLAILLAFGATVLAGCATRPVNVPITEVHRQGGYRFQTRQAHDEGQSALVILAFSGEGTRAAAGGIIEQSAEFQRLLRDMGAMPVPASPPPQAAN